MIEDLNNIDWKSLPVHDDRYITTKIRTYGDKINIDFRGLNVPEVNRKCKLLQSFGLNFYLFSKTNITCKYIYMIV